MVEVRLFRIIKKVLSLTTILTRLKHYTDGDVVNNKTPIGYGLAGAEGLAVWGPDLPQDFLD